MHHFVAGRRVRRVGLFGSKNDPGTVVRAHRTHVLVPLDATGRVDKFHLEHLHPSEKGIA